MCFHLQTNLFIKKVEMYYIRWSSWREGDFRRRLTGNKWDYDRAAQTQEERKGVREAQVKTRWLKTWFIISAKVTSEHHDKHLNIQSQLSNKHLKKLRISEEGN